MKEIELTPYLQSLLLEDIERKNKATQQLEIHLKILFESKGLELPKNGNIQIRDGKLFYTDGKE